MSCLCFLLAHLDSPRGRSGCLLGRIGRGQAHGTNVSAGRAAGLGAAGLVGQGGGGRGRVFVVAAATEAEKLLEGLELARGAVLLEGEELGLDFLDEHLLFGAMELTQKFF